MAFSNSYTAVTGGTLSAAQWNTGVRDNFTAIWVYTTAGDLAYATSSTALARLGIGTAGQSLITNSGATAPEWGQGAGALHTWGQVAAPLVGGQTTTSTTGVDITGLTLDLTTSVTCSIFVYIVASVATSGGTIVFPVLINPFIDGSSFGISNVPTTQQGAFTESSVNWAKSGVGAGTITCKGQFLIENAARTANITRASLVALAYVD
mgnify:FL=1|jgi:hypothetical protein